MPQNSPQIQAIIDRYKASFVEKKQMIDEHGESIESNNTDEQNLEIIHGDLHKLAGSAGMYEFDDIAKFARDGMANIRQSEFDKLLINIKKISQLLEEYSSK